MRPAQQRLETGDLASPHVDDRLIEDFEVHRRHSTQKFALELPTLVKLVEHLGLEQDDSPGTFGFCVIHGEIGCLDEGVEVAVEAARLRHAAAGTNSDGQIVDLVWRRQAFDDGRRLGQLVVQVAGLLDDDRKLVAAQTCDGCSGGHHRYQPFPDLLQELVADIVTVAVVDRLEAVEIHEQER